MKTMINTIGNYKECGFTQKVAFNYTCTIVFLPHCCANIGWEVNTQTKSLGFFSQSKLAVLQMVFSLNLINFKWQEIFRIVGQHILMYSLIYMYMPPLNFKMSGFLKICSAHIECNPKWHSLYWFQIYIHIHTYN